MWNIYISLSQPSNCLQVLKKKKKSLAHSVILSSLYSNSKPASMWLFAKGSEPNSYTSTWA